MIVAKVPGLKTHHENFRSRLFRAEFHNPKLLRD